MSKDFLSNNSAGHTVLVDRVSMQEQAVLNTFPPDFENLDVQDFHLDD